mmetsp:Transcript_30483/g.98478  ORF Transcript_30483/g.98478 Transcript_30483/m.98478 type:complete len:240 (+) Transcript_30483:2292-3011(+)
MGDRRLRDTINQAELGGHRGPKLGEGLVDAVLLTDGDARQAGAEYRERHGDAVVVVAGDLCGGWHECRRINALDPQAVLELASLDAQLGQLGAHHLDPVALLDALVGNAGHARCAVSGRHHGDGGHEGVGERFHVDVDGLEPVALLARAGDRRVVGGLLDGAAHVAQQQRKGCVALDGGLADRLGSDGAAGDGGHGQRVGGRRRVALDLHLCGIGVRLGGYAVHQIALALDHDTKLCHE